MNEQLLFVAVGTALAILSWICIRISESSAKWIPETVGCLAMVAVYPLALAALSLFLGAAGCHCGGSAYEPGPHSGHPFGIGD